MQPWVWWVIAAVVLAILETLTVDLVAIMLAGGAAGGAIAAALGAPVPVQFLVFAAVSAALLLAVRPVARRHLQRTPATRTGVDLLVGSDALVVEQVDAGHGLVRLRGEMWTARPYDGDSVFAAGDRVQVIRIEGATALVA